MSLRLAVLCSRHRVAQCCPSEVRPERVPLTLKNDLERGDLSLISSQVYTRATASGDTSPTRHLGVSRQRLEDDRLAVGPLSGVCQA